MVAKIKNPPKLSGFNVVFTVGYRYNNKKNLQSIKTGDALLLSLSHKYQCKTVEFVTPIVYATCWIGSTSTNAYLYTPSLYPVQGLGKTRGFLNPCVLHIYYV